MFFFFFESVYLVAVWYAVSMFLIGIFGLVFYYYSFLVVLLSIELILLGASFYFVVSSLYSGVSGQAYALMLIALAASETAIGLSLLVLLFGMQSNILVSRSNVLCG